MISVASLIAAGIGPTQARMFVDEPMAASLPPLSKRQVGLSGPPRR